MERAKRRQARASDVRQTFPVRTSEEVVRGRVRGGDALHAVSTASRHGGNGVVPPETHIQRGAGVRSLQGWSPYQRPKRKHLGVVWRALAWQLELRMVEAQHRAHWHARLGGQGPDWEISGRDVNRLRGVRLRPRADVEI